MSNPIVPLLDELTAFCGSDSLSEDGLQERIENLKRHDIDICGEELPGVNLLFLHAACSNKRVTEGMVRTLLDAFPGASKIGMVQNDYGLMPLHCLCENYYLDDAVSVEILVQLVQKYPEALHHSSNIGHLPIHIAAGSFATKSPAFCRILIEAYPGSERMITPEGWMPLHCACRGGRVSTVKYLLEVYPGALRVAGDDNVGYPINVAIFWLRTAADLVEMNPIAAEILNDHTDAIEVIELLVSCDPHAATLEFRGAVPLLLACSLEYNDSNLNAGLKVIKLLYDAHPYSILSHVMERWVEEAAGAENDVLSFVKEEVRNFVLEQHAYADQSKDSDFMTEADEQGCLPIHNALLDNYPLGTIKLFVRGNPSAVTSPDNSGSLPLHLACQHRSTNVVQYLIGLDTNTLRAVDYEGNTALHRACQGANYNIIALLLEKHHAVSASKRNAHKKLPIDLLWESDAADRASKGYTESVFHLLKAYPEIVTNYEDYWEEDIPDKRALHLKLSQPWRSDADCIAEAFGSNVQSSGTVNVSRLQRFREHWNYNHTLMRKLVEDVVLEKALKELWEEELDSNDELNKDTFAALYLEAMGEDDGKVDACYDLRLSMEKEHFWYTTEPSEAKIDAVRYQYYEDYWDEIPCLKNLGCIDVIGARAEPLLPDQFSQDNIILLQHGKFASDFEKGSPNDLFWNTLMDRYDDYHDYHRLYSAQLRRGFIRSYIIDALKSLEYKFATVVINNSSEESAVSYYELTDKAVLRICEGILCQEKIVLRLQQKKFEVKLHKRQKLN